MRATVEHVELFDVPADGLLAHVRGRYRAVTGTEPATLLTPGPRCGTVSHDPDQPSPAPGAPAALGPYSQAVVAGGFVFCSGTAGIDPATGSAPDGIEAQTEQALVNLAAVLEARGRLDGRPGEDTIFYADVDDFAALNAVYARAHARPAARALRPRERPAAARACWSRSTRSRCFRDRTSLTA